MPGHPQPGNFTPAQAWLEQLLERFEAAWQAGQHPVLEDYLPTETAQRRPALVELIPVDLQWRIKAGESARVEGYLERYPELATNAALVLRFVQAEFDQRHQLEPDLSLQEFLLRFPALKTQLQGWLTEEQTVSPASQSPEIVTGPEGVQAKAEDLPTAFGRYQVTAFLGEGGFGVVYKGYDPTLLRDVAIKVPRRQLIARPEDADAYLAEAQLLANLDHTHIVPVHDCGRTEEGLCFVVSKFIAGSDLANRIKEARPGFAEAVELVALVADALHYAHGKGLVHRDVKPGNILLDSAGKPYLADFGLALKEEDVGRGGGLCGTPAYMSPEQANGEGHRVDGRSDIFSLGVVFYEMLTGRRPFRANTTLDLIVQITTQEAKPPRQIDDRIPRELERICLKALAKRAAERSITARDLAEDLRLWASGERRGVSPPVEDLVEDRHRRADAAPLASASSLTRTGGLASPRSPDSDRALKIVPKGLRSFDAQDADFFLELLPGPRDRDGMPDSLRFWKSRIEETDVDNTFPVGLIYGPSGCGKSSLVKAGLLPRLAGHVVPVYVEAATQKTESRLLNGLRKKCPGLPAGLGLKETLAALRRGQGVPAGKKVLIVLDQFEQWLHAHREEQHAELVQALRQCEGGRVQCLVLVRDDFWLAISRFLRELEIRLVEGQNSALVDLFDLDHGRKVLGAFGGAFGKLPPNPGGLSKEQSDFLNLALTAWNADHVDYLAEQLLNEKTRPDELPNLISGLLGHGPDLRERFWVVLENDRADGGQRLRAAGALAAYDPDNPRWDKVPGQVVRQLVAENPIVLQTWAETLRPVRRRLVEPLVERLAEADPLRFPPLVLLLQAYREEAVPLLERQLEKTTASTAAEEEKDALAKRQARVAAALVRQGQPDKVWPMLQHHGKDPRRRTYLLHWLAPLGVEPEVLVQRLEKEDDVTARRALLLSLGEVAEDKWTASQRRELTERLLKDYRTDPDAGVHAALDWLLRRWGKGQELHNIDEELVSKEPPVERQWYVNGQRQTLAVIRGPVEFQMGSPPNKYNGRGLREPLHARRIPRSFAIATKKVMQAQFRAFRKDHEA